MPNSFTTHLGRRFFLLKCHNVLVSDVFGLFYPLLHSPPPSFLTPKGPICHCTTVQSKRNSGALKRPQWNCIYKDVFVQILGHCAGLSRIHQDDRKRGKLLLPSELLRGSSSSFFLPGLGLFGAKNHPASHSLNQRLATHPFSTSPANEPSFPNRALCVCGLFFPSLTFWFAYQLGLLKAFVEKNVTSGGWKPRKRNS